MDALRKAGGRWAPALLVCFLVGGCVPRLISPFNETAYRNATSLKVETVAMMHRAAEPYADQAPAVDELRVNLGKAQEYAKGLPDNELSARQWEILIAEDGDLLGKFFRRWRESDGGLSDVYIREFTPLVSAAFDEIICLEMNKREPARCGK